LAMTGLRLRARPAEYGMNVDRIVAPPTPNDQAPGSAFAQMSPLQDAVRTLGVVNALTFPICNRFDLTRRARLERPIAEAAVATMEIEDETLESDRHAAAWRHVERVCRQRHL